MTLEGKGVSVELRKGSGSPNVPPDGYVPVDVGILEEEVGALRTENYEEIERKEQSKRESESTANIRGRGDGPGAGKDRVLNPHSATGIQASRVSTTGRAHWSGTTFDRTGEP